MCHPLQLPLEELATHERLLFRPPELAQTPDHTTASGRRQVEEDAPEEDATDSDGSEGNVEESANKQPTRIERATLTQDATKEGATAKNKRFDRKAEDENTGQDVEETTEAPR